MASASTGMFTFSTSQSGKPRSRTDAVTRAHTAPIRSQYSSASGLITKSLYASQSSQDMAEKAMAGTPEIDASRAAPTVPLPMT